MTSGELALVACFLVWMYTQFVVIQPTVKSIISRIMIWLIGIIGSHKPDQIVLENVLRKDSSNYFIIDMESEKKIVDIRLNDLLEQIKSLNEMIEFHQRHSGDSSMISQYESMKIDFINKMNQTLENYHLKVVDMPV